MSELSLSLAVLRGFPQPQMSGALVDALRAHVAAHGQPYPVLIDRTGVVWAYRTLCNVVMSLGLTPTVTVIEDGLAAAIYELAVRDLSVLETADLVRAVAEGASTNFVLTPGEATSTPTVAEGTSTNFVLVPGTKRSKAISAWFRSRLGKAKGFSPSQVEQYLRVARSRPEHRAALAEATCLHQAIVLLKRLEGAAPSSPEAALPTQEQECFQERGSMRVVLTLMELLPSVPSWTRENLEYLRLLESQIAVHLRSYGLARLPCRGS